MDLDDKPVEKKKKRKSTAADEAEEDASAEGKKSKKSKKDKAVSANCTYSRLARLTVPDRRRLRRRRPLGRQQRSWPRSRPKHQQQKTHQRRRRRARRRRSRKLRLDFFHLFCVIFFVLSLICRLQLDCWSLASCSLPLSCAFSSPCIIRYSLLA